MNIEHILPEDIEKRSFEIIEQELNGRYISDPLRLRQIVNNLLSNAVKFTQKGEISLTAGYDSSKLTIAIADTGKGNNSQ